MNGNNEKGVILVADEDASVLNGLKALLRGMGYDVLTALGKAEAVNTINAISFDVIILEIGMKGSSDILKHIKFKTPKTKVIAYSKCDDKTRKKYENMGISEFIAKDAEVSLLVDAVQRIRKS